MSTLLLILLRVSLVQLLAAGLVALLVRRRWQDQPTACRVVCVAVLAQGWLLFPWTIAVPWYKPLPAPVVRTSTNAGRLDDSLNWTASGKLAGPAMRQSDRAASGAQSSAAGRDTLPPWTHRASAALAIAWLAGMAILAAGMAAGYRRFAATVPWDCPAGGEWLAEWNDLLTQRHLRPIPLLITHGVGPMLCWHPLGWAVLVPGDLWQKTIPGARRAILRHELAHYRRGDVWKSLAVRLLALPQWFNPAAWWAVRMFDQCAERLCDREATANPSERIPYARALAQLAALRLPVHAVGACAHSHPLVWRVRYVLASPNSEKSPMRSMILFSVAGLLFLAGAVRVELVAKEITYTKETAKAKIEQLDGQLVDLGAKIEKLKERGGDLKKQVDEQIDKLRALYEGGNYSDDLRHRLEALQSGDEAKEKGAIEGTKDLGDEGVIALALAAATSSHEAVRRKAIETAVALGADGYPALAHAFEPLPDADRIFLAEKLAAQAGPDYVLGLASMVEKSSAAVQEAVIDLAAKSKDRVLLFAAIGRKLKDDPMADKMIEKAAAMEGDDGVLLLYAVARHGEPSQRIAAVKAAVSRKQEGVPVVVAAFYCKDAKVRAAFVRAAKAIGGEMGQYGVESALADSDETLRKAAEDALKEPEEKK
jgi:beta-lactamase regulating signal transducer with metallopeptidase domain